MKKIIAISINTSWNIYNFRIGLLKSFMDEGYDIYVISPRDKYSDKLIEMGFNYCDIQLNNKGSNPLEDLKLIYLYFRLLKKIKPDFFFLFTIKPNIYGNIAAKILGIPVISNISGLGTVFLNDSITSTIAKILYRFSIPFAKTVFFQNQDDLDLFVKLKIVNKLRCDLLPGSGIDLDKFKSTKERTKNTSEVIFTLIARMVKDKGVIEFIEAAGLVNKSYPNARFLLIGPYYPGNPTAIDETILASISNDYIKYLGSSDNIIQEIDQSDCVVLPSYREGLSRVLLEAASMAKPIITTDVPGCREVVKDGETGYLCKAKNSKDLARKIIMVCSMGSQERITMGKKGRQLVEKNFNEQLVINKYKEIVYF